MSNSHFRQKRTTELQRLATALRHSQLSCDLSGFHYSVSDSMDSHSGEDTWGYCTTEVIFKGPDQPSDMVPKGASLSKVALSVKLEGTCNRDEQEDPLNDLGVNLKLIADSKDGRKLKLFWYMDRSDSGGSEVNTPVHPRYHFQFGGSRAKNLETGEIMMPSVPRIAHPPLDFCLAVDFVLSNFFKEEWIELRQEGDHYYGIVKDSQRRFWKPYASASRRGWDRVSNQHSWQAIQVWPQLIPKDGIGGLHD